MNRWYVSRLDRRAGLAGRVNMNDDRKKELREIFGEYGCKDESKVFEVAEEMDVAGVNDDAAYDWIKKVYWAAAESFGV